MNSQDAESIINRIHMAQVEAGEAAVVEDLRRKGLLPPEDLSPFKVHTELMGATEPNQPVTIDNAHFLPPGSVVRLPDDAILIHLHDNLWYWRSGCAWCYDRLERFHFHLPGILCHHP